MIESELVSKFVAASVGVAAGGGFLIWFAKLMASRLIKQYDDKHADHEKRLRDLSEKFAEQLMDLKIKLAKLEPMVNTAVSFRDDIKLAESNISVLKHDMKKTTIDLNHAHHQIRLIQKDLDTSKS